MLNSSNATNGFTSHNTVMDKPIAAPQPNSDTKGGFNAGILALNLLIGQKSYKTSVNGMPQPIDHFIRNPSSWDAWVAPGVSASTKTRFNPAAAASPATMATGVKEIGGPVAAGSTADR